MAKRQWLWATLALSSITVISLVFVIWEVAENRFFRDADYITLHYLYVTRGFATSLVLAFWAAWFVLRQRRVTEEELRQSRERYRGLMETFPGAVILFDAQLEVLEWNASAGRLYGYSKPHIVGQPLPTIPASRSGELREFMQRVARGEPVLDVETLRQPAVGEPLEVQLTLLPFREPGRPTFFLEVTSDIRERVRLRQRMLEIEKLTSMGKMAAGTAHHLNSPLAALLLRVQMMRERAGEGMIVEDLARLEEGLGFCSQFVRRLLEFTRAARVEKKSLDLSALVSSAAAFFQPVVHSRQATLSVDAGAEEATVHGDRNLLEALLLILLSNALDAVPAGGEIRIGCHRDSPSTVRVTVSDNGCGIRAGDLAHVFEPFFTTKEPGKGTGLGLAIARNIVVEHGGAIRIESEPGKGTAVSVELPVAGNSARREKAVYENAT